MTRRATVFARAEVTRIVNEAYRDWHRRAPGDALLSFMTEQKAFDPESERHRA
jgi:hypothetical protein